MNRRIVLGRTGLEVSRLGFGGIPIQRVDEDQAVAVVRHAVEAGVDFIDTSRMYTTSEERIGKALQQIAPKVKLATKSTDRTAAGIQKDVLLSLSKLQLDFIDLYQCHAVRDIADYERVIGPDGALEGLRQARDKGLIGHVGITSHSLDLLERVVSDGFFETIMVCYSFLEPRAEEKVIPLAREKGIGVIAMKPFSGGTIPNALLALKYALSQPDLLVLAGVEEKALFDENWKAFQGDWRLDAAEKAELAAIQQKFDKVFCRRCDYCQPCSEQIPIQLVLGVRSLVRRMGPAALQGPMLKDLVAKAENCSECGDCMTRCPYELPIPDLIKENLAWLREQQKHA